MKKFVLAAAIASTFSGLAATPAFAEVSVSANLGLYSEYKFRGISQTNEDPAFQGGFDVDFGNGFYVGNWNSNVDFAGANLEMDFYGGYAGEMGAVSYDLGILKYYYPGSVVDVDALEIYGSLGAYGFTLGANVAIDDDYFGDANQSGAYYVYLGYEYAINDKLSVFAQYGDQNYEGPVSANDYSDWMIGASYSVGSYSFGLTYTDTDNDGLAAGQDDSFIASISTSF